MENLKLSIINNKNNNTIDNQKDNNKFDIQQNKNILTSFSKVFENLFEPKFIKIP